MVVTSKQTGSYFFIVCKNIVHCRGVAQELIEDCPIEVDF